ncbi:MAG: DAK2 domain-containing protein [Oscillospiraceae bacterium]|jgi:DAK2 domain fusion protein YloV|nr:DAK2 domain-containing protein [Oscillospiraceae bacterium]
MLNAQQLKQGIRTAAKRLGLHQGEVDALNVFPVPDGDTGTNMSMTMQAAAREITVVDDEAGFDAAAEKAASAMLRGARGNSGVILSLIFRGFSKAVKGKKEVSGADVAEALKTGTEAAYGAVMKPSEGTILTVVRVAAQKAAETAKEKAHDAAAVWEAALEGAKNALAQTPNMLPVLKQAGVVDAGGQGLVYIMEGLLAGFLGKDEGDEEILPLPQQPERPVSAAAQDLGDIHFAYCTEFIVEKTADAELTDAVQLRDYLYGLGDCVVVVDDDEIIKVHVHNNEPGNVLTFALRYGQFIQVKVENMRKQHEETQWAEAEQNKKAQEGGTPAKPVKPYGIVAVAVGAGIEELLEELGVDAIVSGGQSMNPSTEDILKAINKVPAEHVFVLPNNKNIIMAAEQAAPLTDKGVSVLHTRSVVQGVGAIMEFDETAGVEENHVQMQKAAERVQTGLITYAARDSHVDGLEIRKDSVIGLENGKLTVTEEEPVRAAWRVARHLVRQYKGSMITIYAGEDVTAEQTEDLVNRLNDRYKGEVEVSALPGGQPMYYFMISVE